MKHLNIHIFVLVLSILNISFAVNMGYDKNAGAEIIVSNDDMNILTFKTATALKADGTTTARAWVRWFPKEAEFQDIQVKPGDKVSMTVEAISNSTAAVAIENRSSKQSTIRKIQSVDSGNPPLDVCNGRGAAYAFIERIGSDSDTLPQFDDVIFDSFETTIWNDTQQPLNANIDDALVDMTGYGWAADASTTAFSETGFRVHSTQGSCSK
ncbi:concanavalin A-like lectin/glucanase [Annulohypoxylon truncatum]|uniref:concanavalin A-like lectin/glucanase n=1 Tax=Annulohypoxylon truncatum TaxID=327061 RepID=UPI002007C6E9|nr:concanavalin A-like lectin/glucanase [Annulohypoxylon truncatum]KAI1205519.1 concanavalin A-like lectin/glucanase [Annulohypoxylon truncatum]